MTLVCDPYIVGDGSEGMHDSAKKTRAYGTVVFIPLLCYFPFISGNEIARSELSHHCSCIFSHAHYFLTNMAD